MVEKYKRISQISVVSISFLLLAAFAFSLAVFYTRAPSEGFSRERVLAVLPAESPLNYDRPVAVIPSKDNSSITLALIDGSQLLLIDTDERGSVISEHHLPLDIGSFTHLEGYRSESGEIILLFDTGDLVQVRIAADRLQLDRNTLVRDIQGFEADGSRLVFYKNNSGRLYIQNDESGAILEISVVGNIEEIAISRNYIDETCVGIITNSGGDSFSLRAFTFRSDLTLVQDQLLIRDSIDNYYRKLRAVRLEKDKLSFLFLLRDNRFGLNYLSVRDFDRITGDPGRERRISLPLVNSRYSLLEEFDGDPRVLMRIQNIYGSNLGICRIGDQNNASLRPLTKTRNLSISPEYLQVNRIDTLVFTDYGKEERQVLLSSADSDLITRTTRIGHASWGSILSTTAIHFVLSLFTMWIYLLFAAMPSLIVIALVQRFIKAIARNFALLCTGGSVLYTLMKIWVTKHMLSSLDPSLVLIPLVGTGTPLIVALVLSTLLSLGISAWSFGPMAKNRQAATGVFLRFAVIDAIFYTGMFIIYGITAMLLPQM